ncbi:MAG TPA: hypothetical protein VGB52_05730 [Actinomycetota bacterium]
MRKAVVAGLALALLGAVAQAPAEERVIGDTQVFATLPADGPGMPEGIVVRDGVVFVSTHVSIRGNGSGPPSRIYRYDLGTGELLGSIEIQGQNLSATHGVLAMAFDAAGRLYVVDRNPGRVLRIDLGTEGQQVYATIPDLPACAPATEPDGSCSPTALDSATFADYIAFMPDGSMMVTDLEAATIFRVPAGGGPAQVWYQDARFDAIFGLNGIAVDPSGTHVTFAMTGSQQPGTPAQGVIYRLPIVEQPTAADLEVVHVFPEPATGPDGIAFGAGGRLYVAFAGGNQVAILSPEGEEIARFPDAVANQMQEVPYDVPASVAFDGNGSLLVTNQSFFTATPEHWVVFDVWVDDVALPLIEPDLA